MHFIVWQARISEIILFSDILENEELEAEDAEEAAELDKFVEEKELSKISLFLEEVAIL